MSRILDCAVDPKEYPEERLRKEHIALLKCIKDVPAKHYVETISPEIGKQYLALTHCPDLSPAVYTAIIDDGHIRNESHWDFDILSDGCYVLF